MSGLPLYPGQATPGTFLDKVLAKTGPMAQYAHDPYLAMQQKARSAFGTPITALNSPSVATIGKPTDYQGVQANFQRAVTPPVNHDPVTVSGALTPGTPPDTSMNDLNANAKKTSDAYDKSLADMQAYTPMQSVPPQYTAPVKEQPNVARSIIDLLGASHSPHLAQYIGRNATADEARRQEKYQSDLQSADANYKVDVARQTAAEKNDEKRQQMLDARVKIAGAQMDASQKRINDHLKTQYADQNAKLAEQARIKQWANLNENTALKLAQDKAWHEASIQKDDRRTLSLAETARHNALDAMARLNVGDAAKLQIAEGKSSIQIMLANAHEAATSGDIDKRAQYADAERRLTALGTQYDKVLAMAAVPGASEAAQKAAEDLIKPGGMYESYMNGLRGTGLPGLKPPESVSGADIQNVRANAYASALQNYGTPAQYAPTGAATTVNNYITNPTNPAAAVHDAYNTTPGNGGNGIYPAQWGQQGGPQQQPLQPMPIVSKGTQAYGSVMEQAARIVKAGHSLDSAESRAALVTDGYSPEEIHSAIAAFHKARGGTPPTGANSGAIAGMDLGGANPKTPFGFGEAGKPEVAPIQHWNTPQTRAAATKEADFRNGPQPPFTAPIGVVDSHVGSAPTLSLTRGPNGQLLPPGSHMPGPGEQEQPGLNFKIGPNSQTPPAAQAALDHARALSPEQRARYINSLPASLRAQLHQYFPGGPGGSAAGGPLAATAP